MLLSAFSVQPAGWQLGKCLALILGAGRRLGGSTAHPARVLDWMLRVYTNYKPLHTTTRKDLQLTTATVLQLCAWRTRAKGF